MRTDQIWTTFQTPAYVTTEVRDLVTRVTDLNSGAVALPLISTFQDIEKQEHNYSVIYCHKR